MLSILHTPIDLYLGVYHKHTPFVVKCLLAVVGLSFMQDLSHPDAACIYTI